MLNTLPLKNREMSNTLKSETYTERRSTSWHASKFWRYGNLVESLNPSGFTSELLEISSSISEKLNRKYDACLVNYYADENVGMKYHSDPDQVCNSDEPLFTNDTTVISHGRTAMMKFRGVDNFEVLCFNGDGVSMVEDCQVKLEHGVEGYGERLSYVFKGVLK
ncbi:hypothetical protein TrLO_g6100 [Triparma laevis f. longispina]|uniref:Alpha-ketoglutarate-dependent dioxygenase AlkB-like domain-containing protein n=1 Tax=Triparma laevis f. longispina TaxID=1714387 RepID=A0A9W7F8K3_9STRA|nr:hypothetical protein TrLO_g6100 [Triparma laevis f. longispina]